jgi:hypothetical protein
MVHKRMYSAAALRKSRLLGQSLLEYSVVLALLTLLLAVFVVIATPTIRQIRTDAGQLTDLLTDGPGTPVQRNVDGDRED